MCPRTFELLLGTAGAALLLDLHAQPDLLLVGYFFGNAGNGAIERVEERGIRAAQVHREVQLLRDGVEDVAAMDLTDVHHGAVGERLELQLIQTVDRFRYRLDRRGDAA